MWAYTVRLSPDAAKVWEMNPTKRNGTSWRNCQLASASLRAQVYGCHTFFIVSPEGDLLAQGDTGYVADKKPRA
ncbi:MAG TPA: hypothetical protein PLJ71_17450 [Candidatus Hydrogenedentes bacterium]|nr:hypothetical protein [Candidatus Hydrogenedentota bacterium]HQM50478.1 hypothetical protein [Candidatus Hydrogenedentota bacterium]